MRPALVTLVLASVLAGTPAASARGPVARAALVGPAPSSQSLPLVLPLLAATGPLERYAMSVATPGSPDYARYEPLARLSRWYGASPSARRRVVRFLRAAGARSVKIDATGLFADATISVGEAERAFGTELARFRAPDGTRFIAPIDATATSGSVHLPAALRGVAGSVVGLDTMPLLSGADSGPTGRAASSPFVPSALERTGTPGGCSGGRGTEGFTPNQYLSAYDFDPLHQAGVAGQGQTVALIEVDGFKANDIKAFAACFGSTRPKITPYGVGISRALQPGGEATLDLEVLDAAAPGLKAIDVYESSGDAADALESMTAPLENRGHKPQVVSASLGLCEQDVIGAITPTGLRDVEAALASASATGITYLASSGDDGSADCVDNQGNPRHELAVNYPASSWWVTGVGGTNLMLTSANAIEGQVVWNDGGVEPGSAGGGGLSERFARPDYQHGAVRQNRRAVPDVSMLADIVPGFAIYCTAGAPDCDSSEPWTAVGGTSAATPLLAGGFALIDQELHAAGREDLGLVNPLLYKLGDSTAATTVFDDVVDGDNDVFPYSGGDRALGCCTATKGFDDASGWGSINVAALGQAAIAVQPEPVNVGLSLPRPQQAISSRKIEVQVSCSGACLMAAYAEVSIGRARPFEVDSRVSSLTASGRQAVSIEFSGSEVSKLKAARKKHERITATVFGVLLDRDVYGVRRRPGESVMTETAGQHLTIA